MHEGSSPYVGSKHNKMFTEYNQVFLGPHEKYNVIDGLYSSTLSISWVTATRWVIKRHICSFLRTTNTRSECDHESSHDRNFCVLCFPFTYANVCLSKRLANKVLIIIIMIMISGHMQILVYKRVLCWDVYSIKCWCVNAGEKRQSSCVRTSMLVAQLQC